MAGIERTPVKSSNIRELGYDPDNKILEVEFINGSIYQYQPITLDGYHALLFSKSIGGYFYANIRNNNTLTVKQIK